jgi:hypothetical protein
MNNSLNAINTNISAISKAKSMVLDTSYRRHFKKVPSSSRLNISVKTNNSKNIRDKLFPKPQKKLFSLVDIKEQFHSKAPSVPNQFKRKIYSKLDYYLYNKNSKKNLEEIPQIESYDKKEENIMYRKINLSKVSSRKERLYKPYCWDNYDIKDIKKKQKDRLMPEGYEFYEKNIMDINKNYIQNNYVKIKPPKDYILVRRLNKINNSKSNIFFLENEDNNKLNSYHKEIVSENRRSIYARYQDSDIFNLRKDKNIIEKSGEHSFFVGNNNKKNASYNANNETLLGWKLRKPLPCFMNYTSSKFDLFNREMKNIGKTKEAIIEEVKQLSESFNPTHKQKGLTEFLMLSRVSAPNVNEDYLKALNDNPNVFKKKNNFSSEYYDIYNKYNSLCDKPFQKFNMLKGD